jgi:hypothetical protein
VGGTKGRRWIPLAAEVAWHAGHRSFERPTALRVGAATFVLTVESVASAGPLVAGRPEVRIFIASDDSGRRLRISVNGEGRVKVDMEQPG